MVFSGFKSAWGGHRHEDSPELIAGLIHIEKAV
jgi:hypothetical protein